MNNVNVAVLLPSTGRHKQMAKRVADLMSQTPPGGVDVSVYLAIPKDDEKTLNAAEKLVKSTPDLQEHGSALVRTFTPVRIVLRPSGSTAVEGWNLAAESAMSYGADWLVLGADDIVWHPGWLEAALVSAKAAGAQVVGLNDGHTNLHHYGAHYMVKTSFVKKYQAGYFIPPHYQSWWFDRETCEHADHLGLYVASWDAMAEHLHPEWGNAEMDATYEMGYALHDADRQVYVTRKDAGWPVDWEAKVVKKKELTVTAEPEPTPEPEPEPPALVETAVPHETPVETTTPTKPVKKAAKKKAG